jgi:hypothetical protein
MTDRIRHPSNRSVENAVLRALSLPRKKGTNVRSSVNSISPSGRNNPSLCAN